VSATGPLAVGANLRSCAAGALAIVDALGDWREEIITSLPGELRIYTASTPSTWRRPWLMEDRMYRLGLVAASMGYFREPQLSGPLRR